MTPFSILFSWSAALSATGVLTARRRSPALPWLRTLKYAAAVVPALARAHACSTVTLPPLLSSAPTLVVSRLERMADANIIILIANLPRISATGTPLDGLHDTGWIATLHHRCSIRRDLAADLASLVLARVNVDVEPAQHQIVDLLIGQRRRTLEWVLHSVRRQVDEHARIVTGPGWSVYVRSRRLGGKPGVAYLPGKLFAHRLEGEIGRAAGRRVDRRHLVRSCQIDMKRFGRGLTGAADQRQREHEEEWRNGR